MAARRSKPRLPRREAPDFETAVLAALDKLDAGAVGVLTKAAEKAIRSLGDAVRSGEVSEAIARRMSLAVLADMGLNAPPASAEALVNRWLAIPPVSTTTR